MLEFLILAALATAPEQADPPSPAWNAYRRCVDTPGAPNHQWLVCGEELIAEEDVRLNAAWRRLNQKLGGAYAARTRADLLAEQRAWIAYKDKACDVYANGDWGREGQVLHAPTCRAEVISRRTQALESMAEFMARGEAAPE